ncbi:MAG: hypothetical protein JNL08_16190 [Planctomycetes bacterium]|nr:hypothetical protein [Planctomycetota bacterium]
MDTYDFLADPRTLSLTERRALAANLQAAQARWLARLAPLCEPPQLDRDFPAFLLATAPFADLARRLGNAVQRAQLPAATADELDWFVRVFGDYLRTCDGEDVFAGSQRRHA